MWAHRGRVHELPGHRLSSTKYRCNVLRPVVCDVVSAQVKTAGATAPLQESVIVTIHPQLPAGTPTDRDGRHPNRPVFS